MDLSDRALAVVCVVAAFVTAWLYVENANKVLNAMADVQSLPFLMMGPITFLLYALLL